MRIAVIENKLKDYIINVFRQHSDSGIELAGFLDWKPRQDVYRDIPIGRIEDLDHEQYDAVLIAVKENRYLSRLLTYLHNKQIQNVYVVRLFALDMQDDFLSEAQPMKLDGTWIDRIPEGNEKPYLVHLETHVCDHCNLNCKACNNFSPFVKEPSYADIDQFERDLKRLTELFSGIGRFFLLGGEPLLAPELCCDMIRCFRKYFPTNEIRVLTNATLLLSMKDVFWNCLRENDVIIHISLYPPVKERIDEIRQRLEEERIKYLVFREVETFAKHWTAYPFEDETYNNEHCGSAGCHYLRNGEISKCPDAILVDFMAEGHAEISGLRLHDRVELAEETDAWKLIDKIDSPIDMCRKCAYERIEHIKWERADEEAQLSDWLLPHRYEAEIAKLKCANEKADSEIDRLKRENERADSEIDKLKRENERADSEIDKLRRENKRADSEIDKLKRENEKSNGEIKKLKHEIEQSNEEIRNKDNEMAVIKKELSKCESREKDIGKKYNDIKELLAKAQAEYDRINSSVSYKIGRSVTWFPRKVRAVQRSLKQEGVRRTVSKVCGKILEKLLPKELSEINKVFKESVIEGYCLYERLAWEYGKDVKVLFCAPLGTGDYYITGMYLRKWLERENISNWVFLVFGASEKKITELFPIYNGHIKSESVAASGFLRAFHCFADAQSKYIVYFHHQVPHCRNLMWNVTNGNLMGYHGMNMVDFYLYTGFRLPGDTAGDMPVFEKNADKIEQFFSENGLNGGKTVLLSPYSTGLEKCQMPESFWVQIAQIYTRGGYSVCTNCAGKEKPVAGTTPLCIPYTEIVPFLDRAGTFIGIRSGLCDIISTSKCRKIILHTYKARFWPDGKSIAYTGLVNMGLCGDAIELEMEVDHNWKTLAQQVTSFI